MAPVTDDPRPWLIEAWPDVAGFEPVGQHSLVRRGAGTSGRRASDLDAHPDTEALLSAVGRTLASLHRVPVDGAPLPAGWDAVAERVRVASRSVSPDDLPEPYRRYEATELVELWGSHRPGQEETTVCHGALDLSSLEFVGAELVGVHDLDRMVVADRHLDLAMIQRSLHEAVGGDAFFILLDAYENDPDVVRLDHYHLAGLLLATAADDRHD